MPETALLRGALYGSCRHTPKNNECSRKWEGLSSVFAKLDLAGSTNLSKIVDNVMRQVPMLFTHMSRKLCAQFPAGTNLRYRIKISEFWSNFCLFCWNNK